MRVKSKVAIDCIKDNLFLNACNLSNTVSTIVASSTMSEYCSANDHTTRRYHKIFCVYFELAHMKSINHYQSVVIAWKCLLFPYMVIWG